MNARLFDMRMADGSCHFGSLPQTVLWYDLREHLRTLDGAAITGFITDDVTEAWIDFTYQGYQFSVNDQYGEYWFFVEDPLCPDRILEKVLSHCSLILGN